MSPKPSFLQESPDPQHLAGLIHTVRGHRIMLDADLARLYGVETKALNRAVARNRSRFPPDFMFQLTLEESRPLRYQVGTSKVVSGRGGRRYLPYGFTEQGVAMLSSVLRSPRAIAVNIDIMRAFVRVREVMISHADLAVKIAKLEQEYDHRFNVVFQAIRQLMREPPEEVPRKRIGFRQ